MISICGWFGSPLDSYPDAVLADMARSRLESNDTQESHASGAACLATVGSILSMPDGLVAAISGQPRWAAEDLAELAAEHDNARALAEAYRRHSTGLLKQLHGAFAFAVLDPTRNRILAGIDRIGQQSFYYALTKHGLVFGSTADSVRVHPWVRSELSSQGIFHYVYFHMVPSPGCIYENQRKLPGGHYLDYLDGRLSTVRYWEPEFAESTNVSSEILGEEMRSIILESVRRTSAEHAVGAFLSGGLDSSTVAGMLAQLQPGKAKTYSIGFAVEGYDEMHYARIAARHFGTQHSEYYVTPQDVADIIPTLARSYDEPFGNSSAVPVYYCAKLAADKGVTRMLAGDGGDELFAGNERYLKQKIFEYYHQLPAPLRKGLVEPILNILPQRLPLFRKAQSYIRQANILLPDRLQSYNFLHRHVADEVFSDDFLATLDLEEPLRLQREQYNRPTACASLNRMLYLDWQLTLADNDLHKVNRMCVLAGVDLAYPLLDDTLLEFSCRIPSAMKLKGYRLRHFYKQAMRDFLPTEIITKSKHGFGLPFGIWMRTHQPLRELAYGSLLQLKQRHYFRADFIDQAIEMHRNSHAAYYGELIWVLMILALWLEQHSG